MLQVMRIRWSPACDQVRNMAATSTVRSGKDTQPGMVNGRCGVGLRILPRVVLAAFTQDRRWSGAAAEEIVA